MLPQNKTSYLKQFSHFRYGTFYTMFPVSSLVLDVDVPPDIALIYPELYKDLGKVKVAPFTNLTLPSISWT